MKTPTALIAVIFLCALFNDVDGQNNRKDRGKPNVLFIAVDDLRPELGCYGKSHIKSPDIDRLARCGIVFSNAYANYPQCMSSRASLLSGLYPSEKTFQSGGKQDTDVPSIVSLPMHF
jgi:arylsulfatase A-like enzyme